MRVLCFEIVGPQVQVPKPSKLAGLSCQRRTSSHTHQRYMKTIFEMVTNTERVPSMHPFMEAWALRGPPDCRFRLTLHCRLVTARVPAHFDTSSSLEV